MGKLTIVLKDVAKKSASTMKKSGKKQKQADSKKQSTKKKDVMKSKKKAVSPKKQAVKIKSKEPKKMKMKSVNSLAPSDMDTAPESSIETEICNDSIGLSTKESLSDGEKEVNETEVGNDSIDLSTKEFFSDGQKEVNGGVAKQNNNSNLSNQPEKTKDSCTEGEKKLMDIFKHIVTKKHW